MLRLALTILAWLMIAVSTSAQEIETAANPPKEGESIQILSGRVVDGLERPVPGAKISWREQTEGSGLSRERAVTTSDDGQFTGIPIQAGEDRVIHIEREGYESFIATARANFILHRKLDWTEVQPLPYRKDDDLEAGLREVFSSADWVSREARLLSFLFLHQDEFRPALRRMIPDPHVGSDVCDWLDLLGSPDDLVLIKERLYSPKRAVSNADLIETLKATARMLNDHDPNSDPSIAIDLIAFTNNLDQALIQCGIGRVALTGTTWQFVFRKVDKEWRLVSAREAGCS